MSSVMYNQEVKQQYIDMEKTNAGSLTRYFNRVASKEQEYLKDIMDMDQDELLDTLRSLKLRRESYRGHLLSLFRGYVNWARRNGLTTNANHINRITPESIASEEVTKETMIADSEHLDSILRNGLDYEYYENKSLITELLFRLLYEGIDLTEIQALRKNSIDYESHTVTTPDGSTFVLSDHIAQLWKKCADITFIEKKNGKADMAKRANVMEYSQSPLIANDYLFRTTESVYRNANDMCPLNTLRKKIISVFESMDKPTVPARNIKASGIFNKMRQLELNGQEVTNQIVADLFRLKYSEDTYLSLITRNWRNDYSDWQIAFGYLDKG